MSAHWTHSVATCRLHGSAVDVTSYVVDADGDTARATRGRDADDALLATAQRAREAMAPLDDVIVEAGDVNGDRYVLVLWRNSVLALVRDVDELTPAEVRQHAIPARALNDDDLALPLVLGPSAALALAEEWRLAGGASRTTFAVGNADASPYPPHRPLFGSGPLQSLAADPLRWARPYAALESDALATLHVTAQPSVASPQDAIVVDSLVPLVSHGPSMSWEAAITIRRRPVHASIRIDVALSGLVASIAGAASDPVPAMINDPVAGEHYGYASALVSTLTLGELRKAAA